MEKACALAKLSKRLSAPNIDASALSWIAHDLTRQKKTAEARVACEQLRTRGGVNPNLKLDATRCLEYCYVRKRTAQLVDMLRVRAKAYSEIGKQSLADADSKRALEIEKKSVKPS